MISSLIDHFSIVEDAFIKALKMMDVIEEYDCVKISGGVLPTADPEYVLNNKQITLLLWVKGNNTSRSCRSS